MAKKSAVPLPLKSTIRAVSAIRISGSIKPIPLPCTPVMAFWSAVIRPMDFSPATNTLAATSSATIGMEPPIPLKKLSVCPSTSLAFLFRISSQMTAITKENSVATSTLILISIPTVFCSANTTISSRIGSRGKMAYTVRNSAPPLISSTSCT